MMTRDMNIEITNNGIHDVFYINYEIKKFIIHNTEKNKRCIEGTDVIFLISRVLQKNENDGCSSKKNSPKNSLVISSYMFL